ncbi:MAG: endonuclease/exonuclease/phosphatase family protein [Boseongicola sp. SB0670_bin_30]|nr:endonuclease/exonuclease/phosphatase family protein [Boseongicola sp. SB0670_bin_30]
MIRLVSWNINKREGPWRGLEEMANRGEVDVALLPEAGSPPDDLLYTIPFENDVFWDQRLYDRWPLVVGLSDRVKIEGFRLVEPISELGEGHVGTSGIGTIAAASVTPLDQPTRPFVAVSMCARWMKPHPSTCSRWRIGASDVSAHRILSDLSAFVGHRDPKEHRMLAAGDLNMFYGATGGSLSLPERERTVWNRFDALGLEFLGPQAPNGRQAATPQPEVPCNTRNVPTYYTSQQSPEEANRQFDYVFASRGFHEEVTTRALNGIDEWGSSDHCRILIEVATG